MLKDFDGTLDIAGVDLIKFYQCIRYTVRVVMNFKFKGELFLKINQNLEL